MFGSKLDPRLQTRFSVGPSCACRRINFRASVLIFLNSLAPAWLSPCPRQGQVRAGSCPTSISSMGRFGKARAAMCLRLIRPGRVYANFIAAYGQQAGRGQFEET